MEDSSNDDYSNEYDDFDNDDYFNKENKEYEKFKNNVIYLDEPLRYIINNIEINVAYGNIKVNLLDYLPLFKKGYTTIEDLTTIIVLYEHYSGIYPYTNSIYIDGFKGKIPSNYIDFYQNYNNDIDIEISEFFLEHDFIQALNIKNHDFKHYPNGDIKLKDFVSKMSNVLDVISYEWIGLLLSSKLKLYIAIILDFAFMVDEFLNFQYPIDPRDDNNKAYHLAVKMGNNEIINFIKNKIIELNWLDKQVVIKEFNKYDFLSDDIIKYYQSRKY